MSNDEDDSLDDETIERIRELRDDDNWTTTEIIEELGITRGKYQYYAYDKERREENKEEYRKKQSEYRRKRYREDAEWREEQVKRVRKSQGLDTDKEISEYEGQVDWEAVNQDLDRGMKLDKRKAVRSHRENPERIFYTIAKLSVENPGYAFSTKEIKEEYREGLENQVEDFLETNNKWNPISWFAQQHSTGNYPDKSREKHQRWNKLLERRRIDGLWYYTLTDKAQEKIEDYFNEQEEEENSKVFERVNYQHIAPDIWNQASIETLDSYEDNIEFYKEQSFSYIPIPWSDKFYDIEEGEMKDTSDNQRIREDEPVIDVLEKLRSEPFVLHDNVADSYDPDNLGDLDREEYFEKTSSDDYYQYEDDERWFIVTWADFKKREAKEMVYPLVAELANKFAEVIESYYEDSEEIVESQQLKPETVGRWYYDKKKGSVLHISEYLDMTEMKTLITNNPELVEICGFDSKTKAIEKIDEIKKLRNKVMHANKTLINSEEEIGELYDTLYLIDDILSDLE
ncbi:hypothetical protein [Candidatus Nanohalococcus occultus]|uniref:hypothetical protein n=1 Tax=Candidatus Nanohalococcus occultus TaxID=2978047 RepID=UPI0039E00FBF